MACIDLIGQIVGVDDKRWGVHMWVGPANAASQLTSSRVQLNVQLLTGGVPPPIRIVLELPTDYLAMDGLPLVGTAHEHMVQ